MPNCTRRHIIYAIYDLKAPFWLGNYNQRKLLEETKKVDFFHKQNLENCLSIDKKLSKIKNIRYPAKRKIMNTLSLIKIAKFYEQFDNKAKGAHHFPIYQSMPLKQ